MDASYHRVQGTHLLKANIYGRFDRRATMGLCVAVADEIRRIECRGVLLDLRDFDCDISPTGVFDVCSRLAELLPFYQRRMAVLVDNAGHPRAFERADFLALCAKNRGLPIEAFTSEDEAVSWLRAAPTPLPNGG